MRTTSRLSDEKLHTHMLSCVSAPDDSALRAIAHDCVAWIQQTGVIRSWAEVFIRSSAITSTRMTVEDVEQIIAVCLLEQLHGLTSAKLAAIRKPSGWLYLKCREAVRDQSISASWTDFVGAGSAVVRQLRLRRASDQLRRELHREPTPPELLERANLTATPGTSRWCTTDDLAGPPSTVPLVVEPDDEGGGIAIERLNIPSGDDPAVTVEQADTLQQIQRQVLATVLASAETAHSDASWDKLRLWGAAWLTLSASGSRPTGAQVADHLRWTSAAATRTQRTWNRALNAASNKLRELELPD